MRLIATLLGLLVSWMTMAAPASAQVDWIDQERLVETRLISDMSVVSPGQSFHLGFHQVMPENWHTYWRNPGDAGEPITVEWDVPDGVTIGEMIWPAPESLPLAETILDFGYKNEVTLPLVVSLAEDFSADFVTFKAEALWLVCEIVCVPEQGSFEITLGVAPESEQSADDYWHIRAALEDEPQIAEGVESELSLNQGQLILTLQGGMFDDAALEWRELRFFPFDRNVIVHSGAQIVERRDGLTHLFMKPGRETVDGIRDGRDGVLEYSVYRAGAWTTEHVEIHAMAGESDVVPPVTMPIEAGTDFTGGMWIMIALAFGGGLILNLMPCVFPILSVKVINFVEAAHEHPHRVQRHGLYFMAGVVLSFVALAGLLVLLREFGLPVGWGFQLQVPIVVAVLALLLFTIGLNLMGVFDVGTSLQGVGQGLVDKPGGRAAFLTGVLAVVVAAPCVGPLAAGALGAALTQPVAVVLLVAGAMGLGLALPFVAFSFMPGLLRFLPKPGAWMETFKQALAFPMFASAIWLVWVLSIQTGSSGLLFILLAMLALSLMVWAAKRTGVSWKLVAVLAALGMLVSTSWIARLPSGVSTQAMAEGERAWSRDTVAALRAEGRAVFVDVTAAWCVTCQVNKLRVMDDPAVEAAFARYDVAKLRADWTNRDDEISRLISEHGQAGVPLYLLYPVDGGPARILPTVLSRDLLIEALEKAVVQAY